MSSSGVFEIVVDGMAYGGEGLGRAPDGRMIFVGFSLPGEQVRVQEIDAHKRWGRAELLEVLEPAKSRIEARCRHFGECGGCHYQHTDYTHQLKMKRDILKDQLQRLGKFIDPVIRETIPSPNPWNYRNRLRFQLRPEGDLGFYRWDGQGTFPLEECHLPEGAIANVWPRLSFEAVEGVNEIEVRIDSQGTPMVILHGEGAPGFQLDIESSASVIWRSDEGTLVLAGDPFGWMEVKGHPFRLSPRSFFQTNSDLAGILVDLVLEAAAIKPGQVVFDLYAGVGLFSAFFAQAGAKVVAVEESPSACADFETNLDSFGDVSLYEAPVSSALTATRQTPEVIVLDPPRAGLEKQVVHQILEHSPSRVVYVSCDPATLARDGQHLAEGGYQLKYAIPIDLFPQTYHIESVSLWQKTEVISR